MKNIFHLLYLANIDVEHYVNSFYTYFFSTLSVPMLESVVITDEPGLKYFFIFIFNEYAFLGELSMKFWIELILAF